MSAEQRRSADKHPWYASPAWLSLMFAILLQALVMAYSLGQISSRVDMMMQQHQQMLGILMGHSDSNSR